jgi:predicted nucleic acid-binding protein
VLIDALRGFGAVNEQLEQEALAGDLSTTAISVYELERGAVGSGDRDRTLRLLSQFEVLPLDGPASSAAAAIDRHLALTGGRLDTRDTLIAGIALSRGMAIVTRNRRHFDRVPGLVVEGR